MFDKLKKIFRQDSIKEQVEKLKKAIDKKYSTSTQIDIYMFGDEEKAKLIAEGFSRDFGVAITSISSKSVDWYEIGLEEQRIKVTVFH
ncbi:hypothetical protein GM661_00380 [Iocasia frigidifontis]|uniref:Uncharacterized protein n=1 Tax=Iocasia fonsfrigidae TaxID=2682810 RepID=A0A8A7K5T6_9FIRM|nr:hypothetical protein [Iocasia fonsfrigidae]QTL96530.1 hypothetical protein GM661_00380 [Iocasia fonsfrigidae]